MENLVSYIIPCYNSHQTISHCLSSILNQSTNYLKEIIVVDSSDNRATKKVIEDYQNLNIKYFHCAKRLFAGQARNFGITKSSGNFFALIDSDIILPKNWTQIMLDEYNKIEANTSSKVIMSGTIKNATITKSYLRDSLLLMLSSEYLASNNIDFRKYLPGCNLFFNKNIKEQVIFPDIALGEDILMTKKAYSNNIQLILIGRNIVEHITLKKLHQYSIELGIASYGLSINSGKFGKLLLLLKLVFGFIYKLIKIIYNVIKYRTNRFFKLLFFLPGIIIGSFFFHLGILFGLIRSFNIFLKQRGEN